MRTQERLAKLLLRVAIIGMLKALVCSSRLYTRLAQSPEPCTPYYDLRTASHGYYESMTLNTNIIPLTSIFHNLVSDSLNIQNSQIFDSESHPRWNCIKHHPTTRTLITIPTTRLPYDFPTFFLSNTRSMANKLDEISATITNNKCDVAIITESWLFVKHYK